VPISIKAQLKVFEQAGVKPRTRKQPVQQPPNSQERDYARQMLAIIEVLFEEVSKRVLPVVPMLVEQRGRTDGYRRDVGELDTLFQGILGVLGRRATTGALAGVAQNTAQATAAHQKGQLEQAVAAQLGVPLLADSNLAPIINGFVDENLGLIRSLSQDVLTDAQATVSRGIQEGLRAEVIQGQLEERFGVARNRARLIARDQTNKLFGKVQEKRQTDLGVTHFIWRTVNDERTRPEHAARSGKRYSWDKPPQGEIPGEPINCRCYAEPDLSTVGDE